MQEKYRRFVVRTIDDPSKIELRTKHMDEHLQYLAENEREILVAGSLRVNVGDQPVGALWIVEAETVDRARQLVEADPFYSSGLRQKYELLHWSKAFSHLASV